VVQDLAVRELDTSVKSKNYADKEKITEVPKGILVVDLGGDTWKKENLFGI
jgi:hypothetical protein